MFNETDFGDLKIRAERMSPRQGADISAHQLKMLCDEITRLRSALTKVIECCNCTELCTCSDSARDVAKDALSGQSNQGGSDA